MYVLFLLLGLVMLIGGAELMVRGGGRLALAYRVPVIVVGLTVVAFGTSMPEIVTSITAALRASTDMALGNVIGSNIANIAFVLGLAAMVRPLHVGRGLMRREVPTVVLLQLLVPIQLFDGLLSRIDGVILILIGVGYNIMLIHDVRAGRRALSEEEELEAEGDRMTNLALFAVGVAILMGGAQFFVDGASELARVIGLDERVIGLTVVALGTSAPEAVTAMISSVRDQADMAVGNSLGSNIINVSLALGLTALVQPIPMVAAAAWRDMGVAVLVTFLLIPAVLRGRSLSRFEGTLMVGLYLSYILMLTI